MTPEEEIIAEQVAEQMELLRFQSSKKTILDAIQLVSRYTDKETALALAKKVGENFKTRVLIKYV